jgi:glutaredoxin 3
VVKRELFGTASCPYTTEMREWLDFRNCDYTEYDVERDPEALRRMRAVAGDVRTVPVLVEDGQVIQIGWQGHGCLVRPG